jgi:hypothetical protein
LSTPRLRRQNGKAVGSVWQSVRGTGGARARRQPRLLFRFPGSFQLRIADRQFCGSLFQLPPRITREEPCDRSPATVVARRSENAGSKLRLSGYIKSGKSSAVGNSLRCHATYSSARNRDSMFGRASDARLGL